MKYEIIVLDDNSRLSDESLQFVRQLQQFLEQNFKCSNIAKLTVEEEFYSPLSDPEFTIKTNN